MSIFSQFVYIISSNMHFQNFSLWVLLHEFRGKSMTFVKNENERGQWTHHRMRNYKWSEYQNHHKRGAVAL